MARSHKQSAPSQRHQLQQQSTALSMTAQRLPSFPGTCASAPATRLGRDTYSGGMGGTQAARCARQLCLPDVRMPSVFVGDAAIPGVPGAPTVAEERKEHGDSTSGLRSDPEQPPKQSPSCAMLSSTIFVRYSSAGTELLVSAGQFMAESRQRPRSMHLPFPLPYCILVKPTRSIQGLITAWTRHIGGSLRRKQALRTSKNNATFASWGTEVFKMRPSLRLTNTSATQGVACVLMPTQCTHRTQGIRWSHFLMVPGSDPIAATAEF